MPYPSAGISAASAMESASSRNGPWHHAPQVCTSTSSPLNRKRRATEGSDLAAERFEILGREQPVVLALVREDQARHVAAVERSAHRRETRHAVAAGRALLVAEELQDAAEIGLNEPVAERGDLAARHPDGHVVRPVPHVVGVAAHVVEHDGVAGEAPARVAHRSRRHVAERHRAPALQRLEARIGRGRHHGATHAERDDALVALDERIGVERARPASDPGDGDHLAGLREADDHGRHARRRSPGRCTRRPG